MKKRILVIGAGVAQVDALKRARDMGYYIIASDGSEHAPGLRYSDEAHVLDVKDITANLQLAKEKKIEGVLSYATDIALPTVLAIREELQLPGLSRRPMEISLDKSMQREIFYRKRLSQPDFMVCSSAGQIDEACKKLKFPVIIKPVDNSGSRGVSKVCSREELGKAFEEAIKNSRLKKALIEEFVEGTELTVEGFSVGGQHHILAISDKYKPIPGVATQLTYPADISQEQENAVIDLMKSAYDAMGVDNTPTHSEVMITKEGPVIVEVGCRGGGFYVFTRVVEAVCGYDVVGNWTRICANDAIESPTIFRKAVVLRFFAARQGLLKSIEGLDEALTMDGVQAGSFFKPGEHVPKMVNDGTRTGWMIVCGSNRSEALAKADQVSSIVKFNMAP